MFAGSRMKVFDRLYQDAKDRIGRLRDLRMKARERKGGRTSELWLLGLSLLQCIVLKKTF